MRGYLRYSALNRPVSRYGKLGAASIEAEPAKWDNPRPEMCNWLLLNTSEGFKAFGRELLPVVTH